MYGRPEQGALPRVWLEISRARLQANLGRIAAFVAPLKVMAVLKADAYGLGVRPVAEILREAGAAAFGVAEVSKAQLIKDLGLAVHILGGLTAEEIPLVVAEGFIAPITDWRSAQLLNSAAQHLGTRALGQFKIDTGMGRIGILETEADELIKAAAQLPYLDVVGIYSHFPHAYGDAAFSAGQVARFTALIERCQAWGISLAERHIANSDGIHNVPAACRSPFTMVRSGINLYGAYEAEGQRAFSVEPVLQLKSRLVAVRDLPAGSSIGYGRTLILTEPKRIGTVSIGYADGVPLALPGRGHFLIHGRRCPVLGRVSMDFTTVDLGAVPAAEVGAEVLCLGEGITVSDWAALSNSISYQIICSFGSRVERCYV